MKWPVCTTKKGLCRLFAALIAIGALKLALIGMLSLQTLVEDPFAGRRAKTNAAAESKKAGVHAPMAVPEAVAAQSGPVQRQSQKQAEKQSLSEQWERLRQKKEELRRREKTLQELEQKIDRKLERQAELEKRLQQAIEEAKVLKDKKIKHLVDVYSNMEPQQAARVLESLDQTIAVKILAGMRGRTAGEILTFVQAKKAAALSEALTDFQTPFDSES
jgi:flagellar motility protein MotE (MotC chaperone)